ncbi:CocE/NonD family hydrolase [Chryseobacterium sp. PBS4-4]|uniref:CocE/NonD family hydrolase n=1 Tax=Chryseobacterium edaphi TaxID=2976532 RepID=A0ABT2W5B7_9FLAO|nr:CocE/NonD family hydrolase [Chryseobacterium edaphi]MCU7617409.1 CocE/NonD family hydrolase [Chryseobacterium edaphi]
MKKIFFIYFIFFSQFVFCQKISLQEFIKTDSSNFKNIAKYLAKEVEVKYKEKDSAAYYDNLFRINLVNEKYDLALYHLNLVRDIYTKRNPALSKEMGSQFEIYINTIKRLNYNKDFDKIYEEEFRKKYKNLSLKSQITFPQYFIYNKIQTKKDIEEIIIKNIKEGSIEIKDAVQLCRKYNTYNIGGKTFDLGTKLIKKLEKEDFIIYDSIKVITKNNEILTLSIILSNKNKTAQNTILINTIYSDTDNIAEAKQYAINGYAAAIVNTRGKYLSPNAIEPFEHESEDINEVIDWIIKQPWSNGKVGMIGGSYLGFSQWAATKQLHPALKTIIPQASVGIGSMDFPMNNNIYSSYFLRWLNYVMNTKMTDYDDFSNLEKWNSIYKKWYESGKPFNKLDSISGKPNTIFQRWLSHPSHDNYWQKMVPYKKEFSKISIPILTTTGYYDTDQLGALYYFREHYKYNKNANHYLIIGPYDHSGAQGNIKSDLKGYNVDQVANIDLDKICIEWFDYVLKNKKKPEFLKNKINYQVMGTNQWKSTNSIHDFDNNKMKFYLENKDNNYILSKSKLSNKSFSSLKVDYKNRSDADELLKLEYDVIEDTIYNKNNLIFSTDAFEKPFELSGNFSGNLKFSMNKKDCDVLMCLYELMPNGKYFLLSTYLGRASYAKNSKKRNLLTPNKKETVSIYNNEFVSKKIEAGSKLVLTVGINKSPYYQINYGTGKDVSEETIADAREPLEIKWYNDSYIEIPILKE